MNAENTAEFLNLFLLQINATRYLYLLVSKGNLTLFCFHTPVAVRINKLEEANVAVHPETLTSVGKDVSTSLF